MFIDRIYPYLLFFWTLILTPDALSKESVEVYIYFDKPPFVVDQEQRVGLSYDLIDCLNEFSNFYSYNLVYLPKKRALNQVVNKGVLLWINPLWLGDAEKTNYNWIESLIFDRELYLSNDPNLSYNGPASFFGKIFVGVRGYTYLDLEENFNQNEILRVDVNKEVLIPTMLLKNRADVGVIGYQTYSYLQRGVPEISTKLSILNGYSYEFTRSILFSKYQPHVKKDFQNWFDSTDGSIKWSRLKEKWLVNK